MCETPYRGKYWCYVDPEACCEDKVRSQIHKNLYWSNQPCNGVEISDINDLEERITDDGKLRCTEDSDCPPETPLQSSVCQWHRDLDGNLGEERFCFPGWKNIESTRSIWYSCSNPCNTTTCSIVAECSGGCIAPVSLSSVTAISYSSLVGQLSTTNGCTLRTLPCRCRGGAGCCAPLWGGRNRGIYCPF